MYEIPIMSNDEFFLAKAFELAYLGRFNTSPNPNVGCIIVRNNQIVGTGYHQCYGGSHAELNALKIAGKAARGSTAYVTLEPCNHQGNTPSCAKALVDHGVSRVVSTILDPNPLVSGRGFQYLQESGVKVSYGLMQLEAEKINQGFLKRNCTGLPWIRLKIASSLDGRIAMSSGESKWITSITSRKDVHNWRAESDAILTTSSTIIADDPSITVQWSFLSKKIKKIYPKEQLHQPIRIIIDSSNRVKPIHRIVQQKEKVWLARIIPDNLPWPTFVKQIYFPAHNHNNSLCIDLKELMLYIGKNKINNLLVEAGAKLSGSLISSGLIDELILYQSTKLLGSDSKPLCFLPNLKKLTDAIEFTLLDVKKIGTDLRLRLKPKVGFCYKNYL